MPTPTQTQQLALEKLASSGLSPKQISAKVVEAGEMGALGFQPFPALRIVYLDPISREPMRPRPSWPEFSRYRYLVEPPTLPGKRAIRYTQPPNTGVCAFFPHTIDWKQVFDELRPIYFTEGELKAAKACAEGFPCIGLGGVWNFMGNATATGFLPELANIPWARRKVTIVYDSDARTKPDVVKAINALAHELELRGALPFTVILPELGDKKCGLDDWFVAHPNVDDFRNYCAQHEQSLTLAQPLWEMNERYAFVHDPGVVVTTATGKLQNPQSFNLSAASTLVCERKLKDNGDISLKSKPIAPVWLQWPHRREHGRLVYAPGKPSSVEEYNTWTGWKSRPVKGSTELFRRLIDHLFYTTTADVRDWFLRWLACPIQRPGVKLYTAAVLHGVKTGTGKSFVGYCMKEIYGQNFREIRESDLHGNFNEWARDAQFILGDDVTGSDKRAHADRLKAMITQKELRVNAKFLPSYTVTDCVNYLFTSNQPDAFFLEDQDRRFFVHEVTVDPLPVEFYHELEAWITSEEGRNALHYYLLHLPLGDFDPRNPAKVTESKMNMINFGRSDLALWVADLAEAPDRLLTIGMQELASDLYSSRDLLTLYDPTGKTGTSANAMGRALKRAGVPLAYKGQPITYGNQRERLFVLRNHARWEHATLRELVAHLLKTRKGPSSHTGA